MTLDGTEAPEVWQPKENNDSVTNLDTTKADKDEKHEEEAGNYQPDTQDVNDDPKFEAGSTQLEHSGNDDADKNDDKNCIPVEVEENAKVE